MKKVLIGIMILFSGCATEEAYKERAAIREMQLEQIKAANDLKKEQIKAANDSRIEQLRAVNDLRMEQLKAKKEWCQKFNETTVNRIIDLTKHNPDKTNAELYELIKEELKAER